MKLNRQTIIIAACLIAAIVLIIGLGYFIRQRGSARRQAVSQISGLEGTLGQSECHDTIASSGQSKAQCFQAYLLVRGADGVHEIARLSADKTGHYHKELPPGDYMVNYIVSDPSVLPQPPRKIFIPRGKFIKVNFELIGQHDEG